MKANHLSIMTLEEHEPNPEFIGRNFNAGEIIQLVLKAPYSGHWLSFRSVQMVMMHELAHCLQMNHSSAFWKVNNQFKAELKELWAKDYTGDGLWGRGKTLLSGEYDNRRSIREEVLPRSLCGGAFRSSRRGKRRKAGPEGVPKQETYAERQQRRIVKKFGVNGSSLGGDEDIRIQLEKGLKVKGKPKVANSSRGRELRLAAALARFGQQKEEASTKEDDILTLTKADDWNGSDDESEYEEIEDNDIALDSDGSKLQDRHGQNMIRVCEGADQDDVHVKHEIEELQELDDAGLQADHEDTSPYLEKPEFSLGGPEPLAPAKTPITRAESNKQQISLESKSNPSGCSNNGSRVDASAGLPNSRYGPTPYAEKGCPICSMSNNSSSPLCIACSNVLDISKVATYWRCQRDTCKESSYINAADVGLCGICGSRKRIADV